MRPWLAIFVLTGCAQASPAVPVAAPSHVVAAADPVDEPRHADLAGRVLHVRSGSPLAGVLMVLRCEGRPVGETTTNETGDFVFLAVPAGACVVQALIGSVNVSTTVRVERTPLAIRVDPELEPRFEGPVPADADWARLPR